MLAPKNAEEAQVTSTSSPQLSQARHALPPAPTECSPPTPTCSPPQASSQPHFTRQLEALPPKSLIQRVEQPRPPLQWPGSS
jgi:hypothetical protein